MAPRNFTVTSLVVGLVLAACMGPGYADALTGSVVQSSGTLLAKAPDGAIRVLASGSALDEGDLLLSMSSSYSELRLGDGTTIVIGPDSQLLLEKFVLDASAPAHDQLVLVLDSGTVKIKPGRIGLESGNRFIFRAGTAISDVHGSFIARYQPVGSTASAAMSLIHFAPFIFDHGALLATADVEATDIAPLPASALPVLLAQNTPAPSGNSGANPGLYVQVLDGSIHVTNGGGTQNFTAGQFGFTPSFQQPPVILPANPGMQFTPPPSFSSTASPSGSTGSKPGDVDCIVR